MQLLDKLIKNYKALECRASFRLVVAITLGLLFGNTTWWYINPILNESFKSPIVDYGQSQILSDPPYRPGDKIQIEYIINKHRRCSVITTPLWVSKNSVILVRETSYHGDYLDPGIHKLTSYIKIPESITSNIEVIGYKALQTYDCGQGERVYSSYTPTLWIDLTHEEGNNTTIKSETVAPLSLLRFWSDD